MEKAMDYKNDGAVSQFNKTAEEYQFATSVLNEELITERLVRIGTKSMTQREIDDENRKKGLLPTNGTTSSTSTTSTTPNEVKQHETNLINERKELVKECITHKAEGNESFKTGEYAQAVLHYSLCIDKSAGLVDQTHSEKNNQEDPNVYFQERHIVFANRSACFLKLGHHEKALADSESCIQLNPTYVKGLFRKGLALHAMKQYYEAIPVLANALQIEPKNKQIKQALQFAEVKHTMMMRKRMEG